MPLIPCPTCQKPIADDALECPKCGRPDPFRREQNSTRTRKLIAITILMALGSYLWFVVIPDFKQHGLFHNLHQSR
jgi:predicted amidophosphoribosyltransferase